MAHHLEILSILLQLHIASTHQQHFIHGTILFNKFCNSVNTIPELHHDKRVTCPSVSTPAPIPIVGIVSSSYFRCQLFRHHSSTIIKAPASSHFFASSINFLAAPHFSLVLYNHLILQPIVGLSPRWAHTGIPASCNAFILSQVLHQHLRV